MRKTKRGLTLSFPPVIKVAVVQGGHTTTNLNIAQLKLKSQDCLGG